MNKLWVRLQHQGPTKDRERREVERKELKLLVGSNLVRMSQLDLDFDVYSTKILPEIFDEILSCRDVIAQEYLMEVIIQVYNCYIHCKVFPDDFHLLSLNQFLDTTLKLEPQVNIKHIFVGIVDRFANYAIRSREDVRTDENGDTKPLGLPEDVKLFEIFWNHITELVRLKNDFGLHDTVSLLSSLLGLALNCYPKEIGYGYVDQVFEFAYRRLESTDTSVIPLYHNPLS
jgi:vacuolar protein sorting-associated protein 35